MNDKMVFNDKERGQTLEISYLSKNMMKIIMILIVVLIIVYSLDTLMTYLVITKIDGMDAISKILNCMCVGG